MGPAPVARGERSFDAAEVGRSPRIGQAIEHPLGVPEREAGARLVLHENVAHRAEDEDIPQEEAPSLRQRRGSLEGLHDRLRIDGGRPQMHGLDERRVRAADGPQGRNLAAPQRRGQLEERVVSAGQVVDPRRGHDPEDRRQARLERVLAERIQRRDRLLGAAAAEERLGLGARREQGVCAHRGARKSRHVLRPAGQLQHLLGIVQLLELADGHQGEGARFDDAEAVGRGFRREVDGELLRERALPGEGRVQRPRLELVHREERRQVRPRRRFHSTERPRDQLVVADGHGGMHRGHPREERDLRRPAARELLGPGGVGVDPAGIEERGVGQRVSARRRGVDEGRRRCRQLAILGLAQRGRQRPESAPWVGPQEQIDEGEAGGCQRPPVGRRSPALGQAAEERRASGEPVAAVHAVEGGEDIGELLATRGPQFRGLGGAREGVAPRPGAQRLQSAQLFAARAARILRALGQLPPVDRVGRDADAPREGRAARGATQGANLLGADGSRHG